MVCIYCGMKLRFWQFRGTTERDAHYVCALRRSLFNAKYIREKNKKIDFEETTYKLWKLLDDIDTAFDEASRYEDPDKILRTLVGNLHKKRWDILPEKEVDRLYEKFYEISDVIEGVTI